MREFQEIRQEHFDPIWLINLMRYLSSAKVRFEKEGLHLKEGGGGVGHVHTHVGSQLDKQMMGVKILKDTEVEGTKVKRVEGGAPIPFEKHPGLKAYNWPVVLRK